MEEMSSTVLIPEISLFAIISLIKIKGKVKEREEMGNTVLKSTFSLFTIISLIKIRL